MRGKKVIATLLTLLLILGSSLSAYALSPEDFADMPSDWSEEAVTHAIENGLLKGSDGYIRPNDSMTRAEMAAVINRAFGAKNLANLSAYSDVKSTAWYYEDMSKAVYMGTFIGDDGKLNPENNITRQEAFIVLCRAFKLEESNTDMLDKFADSDSVADWAKSEVATMVEAGYVNGSDGYLGPNRTITRAEFAQLIYNMAKSYITEPGTVTEIVSGNVIIRTGDLTLSGITISGDLIIADGVDAASISLDNVTVAGRVVIRGAGTVYVGVGTDIDAVVVSSKTGSTNITVESGASVDSITCDSSVTVSGEGSVNEVTANGGTAIVTTPNTDVTAGEDAIVIVGGVTVEPGETVRTNNEGNGIVKDTDSTVYEVSTYAQLMEALVNAQEESTVRFTADITSTDGTVELGETTDAVTGATLTVDKSITIDGGGYTLDGDGYPTFEVTDEESGGTNAVIKDLAIENGAYTAKLGGAMIVESDAVLTMTNVTMRNCHAGSTSAWNGGGAIFVNNHHGGTPTLRAINCTFENCYTGTDGTTGSAGAIYGSTGKVYLTNCTFTGNTAANGGAVAMLGTSTLRVTDCTFSGNDASVAGNDIYIFDGLSAARMGTSTSIIKVANVSGTFDTEPTDGNGEVALADMNVVLGRYYGDSYTGTPAGVLSFDGVIVHDVTFASVERIQAVTN